MPCCEISDCAQMSKTIIAVRHFGLGGRESLETAVNLQTYYEMILLLHSKSWRSGVNPMIAVGQTTLPLTR